MPNLLGEIRVHYDLARKKARKRTFINAAVGLFFAFFFAFLAYASKNHSWYGLTLAFLVITASPMVEITARMLLGKWKA